MGEILSSLTPEYDFRGKSGLSGEIAVVAVVGVPWSISREGRDKPLGLRSCSAKVVLKSVETGRRLKATKSDEPGGALLGG